MLLDQARSILILIDYQARLMPAIHESGRVIQSAAFIGSIARELDVPVLGTEQNRHLLGANAPQLAALCNQTLPKTHFSAVQDGLLTALQPYAPHGAQVVLAGCETHVCLLQTAMDTLQAGYQTFVVPQACGSRRTEDKELALRRLERAGVTLMSPEMLAFEWLRSCNHPRFKSVLANIKAQPLA